MSKIIRRIEREAGIPNLSDILVERIKPTDLQSLMLEVYRRRVKHRTPSAVLSEYVSTSFTLPSQCNPTRLLEWDRIAFSNIPDGFQILELSPISPFGSVACMAPISQDWILTTIRNMEVVADPTNILALECARRRQELARSDPTNATPVHLACSHRVVRTQHYRSSDAQQHFRLFSLCSAGRDTGHLQFEIGALVEHLHFYVKALRAFLGSDVPLWASIEPLSEDYDEARLTVPLEMLQQECDDIEIALERVEAKGRAYYRKIRFHVYARTTSGEEVELVEGGATDWAQKLLSNAKERLLISGIGSERLCEKFK